MSFFALTENYSPAPQALASHVILITGAGDGLGKSLAIKCASLGATVILLGKTVAKLENVFDTIENNGDPEAAIYPLDLAGATPEHYNELAETIASTFGRLDAIVHCAASLGPITPLSVYPSSDWLKTLHTNLSGPVFLTQACLNLLNQNDASSVIFSVDNKTRAYWGAYGVSKYAVQGAMKIFADECDSKTNAGGERLLSVNAIEPGPMRTHIRRTTYPGENAQSVPAPDDYLDAYLFLLDRSTDKPNGFTIRCKDAGVDGI